MTGIKAIGTRFEVFKGLALTTQSGLRVDDLVWYNNCVMTTKDHKTELKKVELVKEKNAKIQKNKEKWEEIVNIKGHFIRPKIRYHNLKQ